MGTNVPGRRCAHLKQPPDLYQPFRRIVPLQRGRAQETDEAGEYGIPQWAGWDQFNERHVDETDLVEEVDRRFAVVSLPGLQFLQVLNRALLLGFSQKL